ncbi:MULTISPECIES: hypothetical protein [Kocuria]|uniref:hypothetical protein n=1 Tax=Kocuria TaxID=57493 RepID=UPI0007EA78FD|nr:MULTISPECIES: hypothetical protein [Kocuria]MBX7555869.1 hypothetical protein [Streptomyces sp. tea 10]MCT1724073.1 hypothetical protein [Kocuria marina]MCT1735724.1 hypothetical protein [Kocuria marina]MCT2362419.1 hypothetical protein [Kocuria marina]OBA50442.1 hypothetical protein A5728_02750 [Kocuria sp. ICS0012]
MTGPGGHAGTCVIMGAGSAGLFFRQDALRRGFEQVIVSDKQESRLRIARELGAHTVRVPDEELASVAAQSEPGLVSFHKAVRRIHDGEVTVDYCLGPVYPFEEAGEVLRIVERGGDGHVKFTIVP